MGGGIREDDICLKLFGIMLKSDGIAFPIYMNVYVIFIVCNRNFL